MHEILDRETYREPRGNSSADPRFLEGYETDGKSETVAGALSRVDAAVEVLDASPIAGRSMAGDRGASRVPGISRTPGTARAPGAIGLPHRPAL
jgi:hypothetical protein